jgi:hypothetical protein
MEHFLLTWSGTSSCERSAIKISPIRIVPAVFWMVIAFNMRSTSMMMDFTSAETTAVMEWIEADEARNQLWLELAQRALRTSGRTMAISKLSDALFDAVEQTLPHAEGLAGQLVPRVLTRVNFYEIAAALIREVATDETAEAA